MKHTRSKTKLGNTYKIRHWPNGLILVPANRRLGRKGCSRRIGRQDGAGRRIRLLGLQVRRRAQISQLCRDGGKRKQEREVQISVGEDGGTQVTVQDVLLRKRQISIA
jgi:hypothetical protein